MLKVSVVELLEQEVIKNQLSAQNRITGSGNTTEIIRLSKYLLKLANKRKHILAQIIPEDDQQGRYDPV